MPRVSVIIPNYNHASFLSVRIDSILSQTFQDFEVIILDDCSNDNSVEVIEKYRNNPKISKVIYNTTNSGSPFKQWKKGIEAASANLIWIAESDDTAAPNFLEVLIKPFEIHSDLLISHCRSFRIDEKGNIKGLVTFANTGDNERWSKDYIVDGKSELKNYLKYRNTIPNASAVVFKKPENIDDVLRTDLKFSGDWLFWKELLSKDGKIAHTSMPLNYFRTHSQTTRSFSNTAVAVDKEVKKFKEYRSFISTVFVNPFDDRYRWMMEDWIHREEVFKNTSYYYRPVLHPSLTLRYYFYLLKRAIKNLTKR